MSRRFWPWRPWPYRAGQMLGDEAARLLGGNGTVAIITSGAQNLRKRLDGVRAALSRHPGIRIVETSDIHEDLVRCADVISAGSKRYRKPSSTFIDSGVDVVTSANVDAYVLEWARLERGDR